MARIVGEDGVESGLGRPFAEEDEATEAGEWTAAGVDRGDIGPGPARVQRHQRPAVDADVPPYGSAVGRKGPTRHDHAPTAPLAVGRGVDGGQQHGTAV